MSKYIDSHYPRKKYSFCIYHIEALQTITWSIQASYEYVLIDNPIQFHFSTPTHGT